MRVKVVSMPLFLTMMKKKKLKAYHFNLNNYRNWYFRENNNLKKMYSKIAIASLAGVDPFKKVKLEFTMHRGDKKKVDRANVLSIHEKFFCDALTTCGIIEDDNDNFVESTFYQTGEIDKDNPRVEIKIIEVI
jgi:Holliday junction resolvase RusA-like endonuclease